MQQQNNKKYKFNARRWYLPGSIQFAIVIAIITVVIIGSLAVLTRRRR
jgi:subtilase family serine protease